LVPSKLLFETDNAELEKMLYSGEERHWETSGFSVASFPSGLSKAPFRWDIAPNLTFRTIVTIGTIADP
jgi:hypothetical protein